MTVKHWSSKLPSFLQKKFNNSLHLHKIIANTGWLFADRLLRFGIGILVSAWIARYLGPLQFGQFNYALAFVALFLPFATLGLDSIVVRNIVRNSEPSHVGGILGTSFLLKLIGGTIVALAAVCGAILMRPGDTSTQLLIAIIGFATIFQAFDIIDLLFQSQVRSKYTVVAKTGAYVLTALLRIVLIINNASLLVFAIANLIETILGALGLVLIYSKIYGAFTNWKASFIQARNLLGDSWLLILSGLAIMIYMKIDQIMLGNLSSDKAVGIYSAAVRLSELWYFIPTAIIASSFPSILEARQIGPHIYQKRIQKLFNLMVGLAYTIAIPMTFLSSTLMKALYGSSYTDAGPVLAIHIWAGISVFLGVARESWMTAEGLMKYSFITTLGGAITNIILNYFLIPQYGAMGAAIATVIAYTVAGLGMCFLFAPTRPVARMMMKALILRS